MATKRPPGFISLMEELPSNLYNEEEREAINTIFSIGLNGMTSNKVLILRGKKLYDALVLLSRNNVRDVVKQINTILRHQGITRGLIPLKMVHFNLYVDVKDIGHFQVVSIMALNYVPNSMNNLEKDRLLMSNVLLKLFSFMKIRQAYSVLVLKTAHKLMTNYIIKENEDIIELLVLSMANVFVIMSPYSKGVTIVEKMAGIICSRWTPQQIQFELNALCYNTPKWDSFSCFFISRLISSWPITDGNIHPILIHISKTIIMLLMEKNCSSGALKILEAAIKYMPVRFWDDVYVKIIVENIPEDPERMKSYLKNTVLQCAMLAVREYGRLAYDALYYNTNDWYRVIVIYCAVNKGCLNIQDSEHIRTCIGFFLGSTCGILRNYALKTICIFNRSSDVVTQWAAQKVLLHLLSNVGNRDNESLKDYGQFLSQLCVVSNRNSEDEEAMLFCRKVLHFMYTSCECMIESGNQPEISTGVDIFKLIQLVFEGDWLDLKIKYRLPVNEQYSLKKAPCYKEMVKSGNWPFTQLPFWNAMLRGFKKTIQCNKALIDLIIYWIKNGLPKGADDISSIFYHGLELLKTGHQVDRTEKGILCMEIVLTEESAEQLRSLLLTEINRHLSLTIDSVSSFEKINNRLAKSTMLGLTKCLPFILKKNPLDLSFQYKAFLFSTACCNLIVNTVVLEQQLEIRATPSKAVEYMLIACMEIMMTVLAIIHSTGWYFEETLHVANRIIAASNMKKPVTDAAIAIRKLTMSILESEDPELKVIIIKFLEYILFSIYAAPDSLSSKIRRNPQHRLIIHAIVVADERPNHPFLCRAMEFLLGILSDSSSACGSIASALHTVEIILSDNSLRISTLPYVNPVMVHCINAFSSKDWQIKNAAVQVLKALTERLLGQKCNLLFRCHTAEDIFLLVPEIGIYFFSKLQDVGNESCRESIIAILAVFSESHRNSSKYLPIGVKIVIDLFLKMFLDIIYKDTTTIGIFAAKAYAALYPHLYIPFIITNIVDFLILRFVKMKKNSFYTFLCLLQALYERFTIACYVSYYKIGLNIIESSLQTLTVFLEKFNNLYEFSLYSLLNVKSNSIDNIEKAVSYQIGKSSYQSRLWLNNNVPYLLNHIELKKLSTVLEICFNNKSNLSLKICCLETVVNRHQQLVKDGCVHNILLVFLESLFELSFAQEYLLRLLSNVIFLLFDVCDFRVSEELLNKIRLEYKHIDSYSSIYFVSVYVFLFSSISTYTNTDELFFKNALQVYKSACVVEDNQLNMHAASTLKYLYRCIPVPERHKVLKLAFILLLNDETNLEILKFVSQAFEVYCGSTVVALKFLTSFNYLTSKLDNEIQVCSYLMDLTVLVCSLKDFLEDNGGFYLKQNSSICLHKYSLKQILLIEIKKAFMFLPREACNNLLFHAQYAMSDITDE